MGKHSTVSSSGDKAAMTEAKQAFDRRRAVEDDYQYVNPTEYWAVNGARIMHERFTGRGSAGARRLVSGCAR